MEPKQAFHVNDRVAYMPGTNEVDAGDLGTVIDVIDVRQKLRGSKKPGKVLRYLYTVQWDKGCEPYNVDQYTDRQIKKIEPAMADAQTFSVAANFDPALFNGC